MKRLKNYINPPEKWFHYPQFESLEYGVAHFCFIGALVAHFDCPEYQKWWIMAGFVWLIGYQIYKSCQGEAGEVSKD